MAVQYII